MDIRPDFTSRKPKYLSLRDELRRMILSGDIPSGSRLPASRELARMLKISRNTVEEAYRYLEEDGLAEIRPGRGVFAAEGIEQAIDDNVPTMNWQGRVSPQIADMVHYRDSVGRVNHGPRDIISFTSLAPDHNLFAADAFRKCLNDIMVNEGSVLLNYGYVRGYEPLRQYLLKYLRDKGIDTEDHELLIVNGFRQGLELIVRTLVKAGDKVICESPTYNGALGVFLSAGAEIVGIDMDEEGIEADALEKAIKEDDPSLIYVVPTYQNPTGQNMSMTRRRQVLQLAQKYGVPLLEDGFNEELRFAGAAHAPIKAMDAGNHVIYAGSYSKILFPGLRVGWVLAPKAIGRYLYHEKFSEDIHTGLLHQAGLYEFLSRGYFEKHLRYCRKIYKERMNAMSQSLRTHLGDVAHWKEGSGGFCIWLELDLSVDTRKLLEKALEYGVMYVPGDTFYADGRGKNCIRLGFSRLTPDKIEQGIKALANLIKNEV